MGGNVQHYDAAARCEILIDVASLPAGSQVRMRIARRLCEGTEMIGLVLERGTSRHRYFVVTSGGVGCLNRIPFSANESSEVRLYIKLPEDAAGSCTLRASQRLAGRLASTQTFAVNLLAVDSFDFIANRNSAEVHRKGCQWIAKMSRPHMVGFRTLEYAHLQGFDNCAFCIGDSKR